MTKDQCFYPPRNAFNNDYCLSWCKSARCEAHAGQIMPLK